MHAWALLQDTPSRALSRAPAGMAASTTLQLCPSHCSVRAVRVAPELPTVTQLLALAHEIPVSRFLDMSGDGVACSCQLVPSHTSASVNTGFCGELET